MPVELLFQDRPSTSRSIGVSQLPYGISVYGDHSRTRMWLVREKYKEVSTVLELVTLKPIILVCMEYWKFFWLRKLINQEIAFEIIVHLGPHRNYVSLWFLVCNEVRAGGRGFFILFHFNLFVYYYVHSVAIFESWKEPKLDFSVATSSPFPDSPARLDPV